MSTERRIVGKARLPDPLTYAISFQARGKHSPGLNKPLNLDPIPEYGRAYIHKKVKGSERKAIK